jgi:hypothetical protein
VRDSIRELQGKEPTDEDVIELIETWASEEFGFGKYILLGPDGEDIPYA